LYSSKFVTTLTYIVSRTIY